jgi:hypothetical protein
VPAIRNARMKSAIATLLACGLAVLAVGCAGAGDRGGIAPSSQAQSPTPAGGRSAISPTAYEIRDFNLRVKCPGIHLAKTELKWSERRIMAHYQVTEDQIARCEAWEAAQPKGYIPIPPSGAALDRGQTAFPRKP